MLRILKPLEWWGKKITTDGKNFEIIRMVWKKITIGAWVWGLCWVGVDRNREEEDNCSSSFLLIFLT